MIYTLTLNPSIDYIVKIPSLKTGLVNRSTEDFKIPGGKGINVSRILSSQDIENIALGFIGGFTGDFIENKLIEFGIKTNLIKVSGDSRINLKLKSEEETEINGSGPTITEDNLNNLMQTISKLSDNDILVLAGSIPSSLPKNLYNIIQEKVKNNKVKVIVDTSGKSLLEAIKGNPFLIKPNIHEIEEIFDIKINSEEELIQYGKKLIKLGARNVIISMAGDGALFLNNNIILKGTPPKGKVINSVGAGDSLVGGFLASFVKNNNFKEAFKNGIATGSATAFSLDLCNAKDAVSLLKEVKIFDL